MVTLPWHQTCPTAENYGQLTLAPNLSPLLRLWSTYPGTKPVILLETMVTLPWHQTCPTASAAKLRTLTMFNLPWHQTCPPADPTGGGQGVAQGTAGRHHSQEVVVCYERLTVGLQQNTDSDCLQSQTDSSQTTWPRRLL